MLVYYQNCNNKLISNPIKLFNLKLIEMLLEEAIVCTYIWDVNICVHY